MLHPTASNKCSARAGLQVACTCPKMPAACVLKAYCQGGLLPLPPPSCWVLHVRGPMGKLSLTRLVYHRQVVHDPSHPSAEVGSGIPMDNRRWTKQLGDWETCHVCDVPEVVANDSLHDMVACYVCNSAFQPAKEVRYCSNNGYQARHENGKCQKTAIRALQTK